MAKSIKHHEVFEDVQKYYDNLRLKLAWQITLILNVVFFILTIVYYYISLFTFVSQLIALLMSLGCLLILHYKKNFKLVFLIYSSVGVILCNLSLNFHHETIHYVEFLWLFACTTIAYFTFGPKVGRIFLVIITLSSLYFIFFVLDTHLEYAVSKTFIEKVPFAVELVLAFAINVYLFHLFTSANNYSNQKLRELNTQLKEQNNEIRTQNAEKTILVREIHHRVKNNLQIIVSLLRMQSSKIDNEKAQTIFQESINRIMSMALIHQKLYQNSSLSKIMLSNYINDLITTILSSSSINKDVNVKVHSEIDTISLESLVPLGLIINELASNSLKHAFHDIDNPEIDIKALHIDNDNWIELIYHDNGKWKEHTEDYDSFGISLIEGLAEQLDGSIKIQKLDTGTIFIILLKNSPSPDILA